VGLVVFGQREAGADVLGEDGVFAVLDILDECSVDSLLGGHAISVNNLLLESLGEECLFISLLGLVVADESLVGNLGHIDTGNVDLGAGGEGVNLVDALKGHAVQLVGTSHEEEAGLELLKEDDSVSAESAGKEYEHTASLDALAELGGAALLCSDLSLDVLCGVPLELFDH